ncbi:MAG: Rep domain protein [Virus sp.]|nr:MAG: Rep domain protein [Virus sp.]
MSIPLGALGGEGGNIQIPLPPTVVAKNGQVPQRKNHFFTWNNYTEEQIVGLLAYFNAHATKYAFQEEIGPEKGTPHLQGMVMFPKEKRSTVWDPKSKACWLPLKKTDGAYQLKEDSRKPGGRQWSKGLPKPIKIITELRPWQAKIEKIILSEPDTRKIYWFWESVGRIGKSEFTKYCVVKHKVLFCDGGKKSDLINLVFNQNMDETNCLIWDLPRSTAGNISYATLESVKNGMVCNTKYETGVKIFNSPHIIVFANFPPDDPDQLSADRWIIEELKV